jgi:hypothetical protein
MLYDDADFQGYDPLSHFCQAASSGEHVNVVVLQDSLGGPARLHHVDSRHSAVLLKEMGEINMGDPETLFDFIAYAKSRYPAHHYVLAIYDHGAGWRGSCWDETSDNDNLTMDEMCEAITGAGGVDLILFSAPCLMGALESAYELRNCTEFYVAAEDLSGYCWWVDAMGDICRAMAQDRPIGVEDLTSLVIDSIWQHRASRCLPGAWPEEVQMAAIQVDRLAPLVEAFDSLSIAYIKELSRFRYDIQVAFDSLSVIYYQHVDTYDFASCFRRVTYSPPIRRALDRIKTATEDAVFAECHGRVRPWAHGLNVYFPDPRYYGLYDSSYGAPELGLDFARDTHWDELLSAYFGSPVSLGRPSVAMPPASDGFMPSR